MRSTSCDYTVIGKRIKQIRKSKGCTQEQLAEMINISPKNISLLENGKMGISVSSLIAISKALDISTDYLLFGEINEDRGVLSAIFSDLNENERFYAEKLIITFAEACKKMKS